MGCEFLFSDVAIKDLDLLEPKVARRMLKKIKWFCDQDDPLSFAKALTHYEIGQYRFRVGDYRVICDAKGGKIVVLRIGHRSDIYR